MILTIEIVAHPSLPSEYNIALNEERELLIKHPFKFDGDVLMVTDYDSRKDKFLSPLPKSFNDVIDTHQVAWTECDLM